MQPQLFCQTLKSKFNMSKGSSFWGTATGKVGNLVISVNKGQRIEKAYQPHVLNRKTNAQMIQRARFANAVKFYKRAYANFFQFAYEDKSPRESDYNAFMRHNTNLTSSLLKYEQVKSPFIALGEGWVLSNGILAEPVINDVRGIHPYLSLPSLIADADTVGELSQALINDYSLIEGDIITLVTIVSNATSLNSPIPNDYARWIVKQFIVNTNSNMPITDVYDVASMETGKGLYLDIQGITKPKWYGVVFSRKSKNAILRCSTSRLLGNSYAYQMYLNAQSQEWQDVVLQSWQASGEAVLEGTLVQNDNSSTIATVNGDEVPRSSSTVFNQGITSTAALTGTNLDKVKITDFTFNGGSVIGYDYESSTQATITLKGDGSRPNDWTLYFFSKLIARCANTEAVVTSASPSSVAQLDNGDTLSIDLIGTNLDGFEASKLAATPEALTIMNTNIISSSKVRVTLKATDDLTTGSLSYDGKAVFTIKAATATITSPANGTQNAGGNKTFNLVGTNLTTLTAASFITTGSASVVSYEATSDTAATLVVSTTSTSSGTVKYGSWQQTFNAVSGGGNDEDLFG